LKKNQSKLILKNLGKGEIHLKNFLEEKREKKGLLKKKKMINRYTSLDFLFSACPLCSN